MSCKRKPALTYQICPYTSNPISGKDQQARAAKMFHRGLKLIFRRRYIFLNNLHVRLRPWAKRHRLFLVTLMNPFPEPVLAVKVHGEVCCDRVESMTYFWIVTGLVSFHRWVTMSVKRTTILWPSSWHNFIDRSMGRKPPTWGILKYLQKISLVSGSYQNVIFCSILCGR